MKRLELLADFLTTPHEERAHKTTTQVYREVAALRMKEKAELTELMVKMRKEKGWPKQT